MITPRPLRDADLAWFKAAVATRVGLWFDGPRGLVLRERIERVMQRRGLLRFSELRRQIERSGLDQDLINQLTNNDSFFFRDTAQIEASLERLYRSQKRPIRVLSAGCASGEEPLTVAMLALEMSFDPKHLAIDALDLDSSVLARARSGVYRGNQFRATSSKRLRLNFVDNRDDTYSPRKSLLPIINYRQANLLDGLPEKEEFDLVLCRNVLIYFRADHREIVLRHLAAATRPSGLIVLGSAESLVWSNSPFEPITVGDTILYQKGPGS